MKLYIIRHGETQWNHLLRLQGQTDIELNENGRLLAQVTARALQKVPFTKCYTSPLSRAKETAQLVLGDRQIPLVEEARISEISFGTEEGVRVKNEDGTIVVPRYYDFFRQPDRYVAPEGGESLEALLARTGDFLRELAGMEKPSHLRGEGTAPAVLAVEEDAAAPAEETILVSTHGAASRALLANIRHSALADFWDTGVPKNCAVTIVRLEPCGSVADPIRAADQKPAPRRAAENPAPQGAAGNRKPRWVVEAQDLLFYSREQRAK